MSTNPLTEAPVACKVLLYGDVAVCGGKDAGRVVEALVADGHAAYVGYHRCEAVARVTTRFSQLDADGKPISLATWREAKAALAEANG
jgi:hypothetical protein